MIIINNVITYVYHIHIWGTLFGKSFNKNLVCRQIILGLSVRTPKVPGQKFFIETLGK